MVIGNRIFDRNKTQIMGILNVTPDSFSDGGKWNHMDAALFHTQEMIEEGAAVIDVGGESTRPGYEQISDEEEIARVVPVIEAIRQRFDVPISVDTYKSEVAKAALSEGADLINDIWGLKYDRQMAQVIAEAGVPCCLMHNRKEIADETAHVMNDCNDMECECRKEPDGSFMSIVLSDLQDSLDLAEQAGIARDRIILDPGVGFAKTYEQNLTAIRHVGQLHKLGCPVLLGTSRKSVIGLTLDLDRDQRVEGTLVTTVYAVQQGCMFVRVHDVKENARAIRMVEAILSV